MHINLNVSPGHLNMHSLCIFLWATWTVYLMEQGQVIAPVLRSIAVCSNLWGGWRERCRSHGVLWRSHLGFPPHAPARTDPPPPPRTAAVWGLNKQQRGAGDLGLCVCLPPCLLASPHILPFFRHTCSPQQLQDGPGAAGHSANTHMPCAFDLIWDFINSLPRGKQLPKELGLRACITVS